MAKKRVGKFPKEFIQIAVDQLKTCDNISELSKKLNVHRRLLYTWRDKLNPPEPEDHPPINSRDVTLRKEVRQLKRVLADKTLEVDFFKNALQKVKARRQRNGSSGGKASTTKSGK